MVGVLSAVMDRRRGVVHGELQVSVPSASVIRFLRLSHVFLQLLVSSMLFEHNKASYEINFSFHQALSIFPIVSCRPGTGCELVQGILALGCA